jgi:hypothetical protein
LGKGLDVAASDHPRCQWAKESLGERDQKKVM